MLQDDRKLIATQARQRIARADGIGEQLADLLQQLVADRMTAGVVHQLELVDVDIQHRMLAAILRGLLQHPAQARFELAAIHETRQRIMRRVVVNLAGGLTQLLHRPPAFQRRSGRLCQLPRISSCSALSLRGDAIDHTQRADAASRQPDGSGRRHKIGFRGDPTTNGLSMKRSSRARVLNLQHILLEDGVGTERRIPGRLRDTGQARCWP